MGEVELSCELYRERFLIPDFQETLKERSCPGWCKKRTRTPDTPNGRGGDISVRAIRVLSVSANSRTFGEMFFATSSELWKIAGAGPLTKDGRLATVLSVVR